MSIEQRVKKIVAEQLGVNESEVKNESSFVNDLGADSLDTVELVMALEEEFECEIPDEDAEKITTVQQAIDYVLAHQKKFPSFPVSKTESVCLNAELSLPDWGLSPQSGSGYPLPGKTLSQGNRELPGSPASMPPQWPHRLPAR